MSLYINTCCRGGAPLGGHRLSLLAFYVGSTGGCTGCAAAGAFSSGCCYECAAGHGAGMLCLPCAPLWRAGVCCQCRCPGCGLSGGLMEWFCQLSSTVCPVMILCAAADCARWLQLLLLAAGGLRSLLCPDASIFFMPGAAYYFSPRCK